MPTTRLYAASIAIVSGVYSITTVALDEMTSSMDRDPMMGGPGMTTPEWFMAGLGLVVLIHGVVLLTPAARALGRLSGPLMVVWALLMLLNQGLAGTMAMAGGMEVDAGMVAVASLMLVSGIIMIVYPMSDGTTPSA